MSDSQTLYLLRHARAESWAPGQCDLARNLDKRGQSHLGHLATWVQKHLTPPDTVLCSPAERTRQTMEPLREQWIDPAATIEICQDIYEATTGRLQQLADKAFASTRRLMIIGHNPGLEHLARLILGEATAGDPRRMSMGALLVIEFPNGWGEGEGEARLQHWLERYHFE